MHYCRIKILIDGFNHFHKIFMILGIIFIYGVSQILKYGIINIDIIDRCRRRVILGVQLLMFCARQISALVGNLRNGLRIWSVSQSFSQGFCQNICKIIADFDFAGHLRGNTCIARKNIITLFTLCNQGFGQLRVKTVLFFQIQNVFQQNSSARNVNQQSFDFFRQIQKFGIKLIPFFCLKNMNLVKNIKISLSD